jgi:uncharacterized membrane-anchored protein YhcB (DUF1043 family)
LRVRRTGDERVRTFHLGQTKCTIGSSPQCQVCLPTSDVRPLHCLLSLESGAATLTRWAKGALLNGREFSKAALSNGDRILIGRWEIEFGGWDGLAAPSHHQAQRVDAVKPKNTAAGRAEASSPEPEAVADSTSARPALTASSSQAFEDRLVLELWTRAHLARQRAKGLITGMRAARFQADALAADLSAMETELDLARAAYDSHLGHQSAIEEQVAEHYRVKEEQIASLTEDLAAVQQRLAETEAELTRQIAECRELSTQLSAARCEPSEQAPVAAEQAAVEAVQPAADFRPAPVDPWQNVSPLAAEEVAGDESPSAISWGDASSWRNQPAVQSEALTADADEPTAFVETSDHETFAEPVAHFVEPQAEHIESEMSESVTPVVAQFLKPEAEPIEEQAEVSQEESSPSSTSSSTPGWSTEAEEAPQAEFQATSFIDKYRHLLKEDGEAPAGRGRAAGHSLLDEEFLSPKKAVTCATPADESDEALEAYMANMMRRVRSNGSSLSSGPADQAPPAVQAITGSAPYAHASLPSVGEFKPTATEAAAPAEPMMDFETLLQSVRKPAPATDLAALREIANSSARTAIATHIQRRSHESAMSKIAVALTATCSSAYLMASAPGTDNWMFWAGLGTCTVGIAAAVQVLVLERRRASAPSEGAAESCNNQFER